jgi:phosphate transport system ATP-binding protein
MAMRVEAKDVNVHYGSFRALADVSMTIEAKSVTALIGPSGCGKSTFLRTINRMVEVIPDAFVEGAIEVDGEDIYAPTADAAKVRRSIGMVFQKPNPFPSMSIRNNVLVGLRYDDRKTAKSDADRIVEQSLTSVNLWEEVKDRLDKPGGGLSGGQQQRLCIARAIAVEPAVLLMDEPASALDPISTAAIESLILQLKESFTIVIVTHNMQQAKRISDSTGFFNISGPGTPGRLVEFGPTAQIFYDAANESTSAYVHGRFG